MPIKLYYTAVLKFWFMLLYYFDLLYTYYISMIFKYIPDSYIKYIYPNILYTTLYDNRPNILNAYTNNEDITNKFKVIIYLKWDSDIVNENNLDSLSYADNHDNNKIDGGLNCIDIKKMYPSIYESDIYISYNIGSLCNDTHNQVKNIKFISFNCTNACIYRSYDLNERLKIICGEIPF